MNDSLEYTGCRLAVGAIVVGTNRAVPKGSLLRLEAAVVD